MDAARISRQAPWDATRDGLWRGSHPRKTATKPAENSSSNTTTLGNISSSMVMCFHFVNQYGNSRAVPNMLLKTSAGGLTPAGTFWLFTVITIMGGVWAWFFIPETAGRSLEGMDRLFTLKWYQIGRFGEDDANVQQAEADKYAQEKDAARETVQQVEKV